MRYGNQKTRAVIGISSVIKGGDWQEIKPARTKPKRTVKKKNE